MIAPYVIGFIIYVLSVMVSYSVGLKQSNWYFPVGLTLAIIVNILWLYIAKHSPDKNELYIRALIWDAMIVGAFVVVPLVMHGVRLSGWTLVGCIFIIIGLVLTKVS